jgi:polyhydroxybutyrate depolymerase
MLSFLRQISLLLLVLMAAKPGRLAAQTTLVKRLHSGALLREYRLYVPASYQPGTRVPLLLNLHALGSSAAFEEYHVDFRPIADTANFLILVPNGELNYIGQQNWNVFDAPGTGGVDDVAFLAALIDTICARYSVDSTRIYSTGRSNGGFMSYELACQLSHRIAAVASVAGTQNVGRLAGCNPQHPTPILAIHGTADNSILYDGTDWGTARFASVPSILNYWVQYNHCLPTPTIIPVPDIDPTDGCTAEHYIWPGGRNGSVVEHFRINGGAHTWPGALPLFGTTNMDISACVEIWRFFRRYRLGQLAAPQAASPLKLEVWPNPVDGTGLVTLYVGEAPSPASLKVFDALGREVWVDSFAKNSYSLSLDTRNWPGGVYFLQVTVNQVTFRQKLVK